MSAFTTRPKVMPSCDPRTAPAAKLTDTELAALPPAEREAALMKQSGHVWEPLTRRWIRR
jgi:hypothetical protein